MTTSQAYADADDSWLLTALPGDALALETFYRRHVSKVIGFASRRCATPEDTADLVAATFLALIGSASKFDQRRGTPVSYLLGIAARLHAGRARRWSRERRAIERMQGHRLLDADDHARLEEQIDAARAASPLATALAALPSGQRDVLDLISNEGLTVTQAAHALGIAPATARVRLSRARRAVQAATPSLVRIDALPGRETS